MKKLLVVLVPFLVLALMVISVLGGTLVNVRAQDALRCIWPFEATVRQGPNTGTALVGDLTVDIGADGALTGTLATQDSQMLNVVGQVVGRAVSLGFELQAPSAGVTGMYVFGTGTAWQPVSPETNCGGMLGGTFAGPQPGDIGDWFSCIRIKSASLMNVSYVKPALGSAACS
jgi:hypothetical protein